MVEIIKRYCRITLCSFFLKGLLQGPDRELDRRDSVLGGVYQPGLGSFTKKEKKEKSPMKVAVPHSLVNLGCIYCWKRFFLNLNFQDFDNALKYLLQSCLPPDMVPRVSKYWRRNYQNKFTPTPLIFFKRLSKYCIHVVIKLTPRILLLKKVTILNKKQDQGDLCRSPGFYLI